MNQKVLHLTYGCRGKDGVVREFGIDRNTAIFKVDNQQCPTVQHRELGFKLLISYTPIQNKMFKKGKYFSLTSTSNTHEF